VLQLHRMAPRDPADHLMTKGKSASATDDSDDRAARRRCSSSPASTEPHSVAPVSYNVQRLATRRLPCTVVSHVPPDVGEAVVSQERQKRRVLRSAPQARVGANHSVMCSGVTRRSHLGCPPLLFQFFEELNAHLPFREPRCDLELSTHGFDEAP